MQSGPHNLVHKVPMLERHTMARADHRLEHTQPEPHTKGTSVGRQAHRQRGLHMTDAWGHKPEHKGQHSLVVQCSTLWLDKHTMASPNTMLDNFRSSSVEVSAC